MCCSFNCYDFSVRKLNIFTIFFHKFVAYNNSPKVMVEPFFPFLTRERNVPNHVIKNPSTVDRLRITISSKSFFRTHTQRDQIIFNDMFDIT